MSSRSVVAPRHSARILLILGLSLLLLFLVSPQAFAATLTVDPAPGCSDVTGAPGYCTIQAAVTAALSGDTVFVKNGTYNEAVQIDKDITLQGESRAGVIIDAVGKITSQGYSMSAAGDYTIVLQDFTFLANPANPPKTYGIKISGDNANVTIKNVTVTAFQRSGIDLNGVSGGSIENVSVSGATYGVGIGLTDVSNFTLKDITTSGNAWGGIAIYTWGRYYTGGSANITLTGVNNLGEDNPFYIEVGNYGTPGSPYPVTGLTQSMFTYTVVNNSVKLNHTFYQASEANALAFAAALGSLSNAVITELATGNLVVAPGMSIQTAINAAAVGGTVDVEAGTYTEQLLIEKSLTLSGAGSSTVIKSPAVLATQFTTSAAQKPVITAKNANPVHIQNLVVDGAGVGNANYKMHGIAYYNAGGSIVDTEIKDIRDTPFSGNQHGVGIYAYMADGATRNLAVRGNYIHDFQKNAMNFVTDGGSVLSVQIIGNRIVGAGATTVTAQNGIQVYQLNGRLDGYIDSNTITGIAYDNTLASTKYVATSILDYYADVDISNNVISDGHMGIYNYDAQGAIANNKIDVVKVGVYAWGIIATDPPLAVPSPYEPPLALAASAGLVTAASATVMPVNISGNVITFSGPDNSATYGIEADAGYGARDVEVTATYNTVTGFEVGMGFYQCTSACTAAKFTSVTANQNNLSGNTGAGMETNVTYLTVNGENNWWGAASGPGTVGPGTGDKVSTQIDYDPYRTTAVPATLSVPATTIVLQRSDPHVISLPVVLTQLAGDQLSSVAYSINYDELCLSTSAAQVSALPAGFQNSVAFDGADTTGELDIAIWDNAPPLALLSDGALATTQFNVLCWGTDRTVDVFFSNLPAPSFGDPNGQSVFRSSLGASVPLDFNSPATDFNLSAVAVVENLPVGTPVGTFSNNDPDGTGDTYVYSLVAGTGDTDNGMFTIVGNELRTAASFNFEVKSSYSILVQLNDGKGGVITKVFTITITDTNEAPTAINLSATTVDEAVPANTVVGTFSTVDVDAGDTFSYVFVAGAGDADNGAFTIVGDQLKINASPDFDVKPSYTIRVKSTDSGGLTIEQSFTIAVIDRSQLKLPVELDLLWVAYNGNVSVPVAFVANGNAVRSASFTVNFNQTCLSFKNMSGLQSGWTGTGTGAAGSVAVNISGSANLANGTMAVLNFSATDACSSGTVSPLTFAGTTSLKTAALVELPKSTVDGALHIVSNTARGDCNSDGLVNAADFVAEVIEAFDANSSPLAVNHWLYVHTGSFPGSAIGCDANVSTLVDVADVICTVMVVFGDNSCTLPAAAAAQVSTPAVISTRNDLLSNLEDSIELPIALTSSGESIAGAAFTLEFDASQLTLDGTDADGDGIADAIHFNVPASLMRSVQVNEAGNRIDFAIADLSLPLQQLSDGPIVTVHLTVNQATTKTGLTIDLSNASLGNLQGRNVPVLVEVLGSGPVRHVFIPAVQR